MKQVVLVTMLAAALAAFGVPALSAAPASVTPLLQAGSDVVPTGAMSLGSVRIGRRVMANGQPLPAGTYQVRLTAQEAQPTAAGAGAELERWVEFLQGGQVKGREVVSIVPKAEVKAIAKTNPPAPGTSRVEMLKGNEYLRVWINRGGISYLIHMPIAS
jgi:hypothetical protein